jgi:hypothetical protein
MGRGYITAAVRRAMGYPAKGYVRVADRKSVSANEGISIGRFLENASKYGITDALFMDNTPRGRGFTSSSSSLSSTNVPQVTSSLAEAEFAGKLRATQLLAQNLELANTDHVMLPNGTVVRRPTNDLTPMQALEFVAQARAAGRAVNDYEKALAMGDVLTPRDQYSAQEALRDYVGREMALKSTFDSIPSTPQELLRRAAGVNPLSTAKDVSLKARNNNNNNNNNRDNRGGGGGGGGGGRGYMPDDAKHQAAIRIAPKNSTLRDMYNEAKNKSNDQGSFERELRLLADKKYNGRVNRREVDNLIQEMRRA